MERTKQEDAYCKLVIKDIKNVFKCYKDLKYHIMDMIDLSQQTDREKVRLLNKYYPLLNKLDDAIFRTNPSKLYGTLSDDEWQEILNICLDGDSVNIQFNDEYHISNFVSNYINAISYYVSKSKSNIAKTIQHAYIYGNDIKYNVIKSKEYWISI
jgi:hypothetical protein